MRVRHRLFVLRERLNADRRAYHLFLKSKAEVAKIRLTNSNV